MKYLSVIALLVIVALLTAILIGEMHKGALAACYDIGRVVGGAEQRVLDAKLVGGDPLDSDVARVTPHAECK